MVIKNESAAVSSATATLRRDVERLDVKMKEDIDNLKHEYAYYVLDFGVNCLSLAIAELKWSWTVGKTSPRQILNNRTSLLRYAVLHCYAVASGVHIHALGIIEQSNCYHQRSAHYSRRDQVGEHATSGS
jgi:hypothetical protein